MDNKLKILHLEDSLNDSELIRSIIETGGIEHKYYLTDNEKDFIKLLESENIDLILSDYNLPDFSGREAFRIAREKFIKIPFIFVSGTIGEDYAINAMVNGATDYVLKNKLERLVPAIKRARRESELELKKKEAEKALQVNEEKFQSIMENSADAIFITDQHGKYVYTNKAVTSMLGFSSEEMKCKTILDMAPQNRKDEYLELFSQLQNKGKLFTEIELLKKNGTFISTDLNAIILPDGLVYGSSRDITERNYAKEELIKAKEKAEEGDRLKTAFLTNMSHEIRTPMNGIIGFTELLKEPFLTVEEQQGFIQTIQISGARMLNTINSIVDMSRIESGLISVDIMETNLNEKIEFTYKFFKPEVESKGLQFIIKTSLAANEANIKTDNEKVYGILTNLVRNAIKFTFEGSIEFGYDIVKTQHDMSLQFFVKDTGVGIPENQKELIFERFRQGSESHNRGYEGSGLGLTISKSYVEMLGGKIWVESEEGKGSIFYFTIPYNPVSEETHTIENVVSTKNKEVQLKSLKILIVEDDEISYSLLTRTLQKISKEVLHAITGVQAIEACRNNPDLDLVLMDIRMPVMNGLEATQQIRQFNKSVIIIAQTAYGFSGDCEKALEAGCNDYISKPINKTLLYELIKKHIGTSKFSINK